MASIDLRGLHKLYDKTPAVRGVDLSVEDGEFVVILGPSGCGKSTLLRMIAGLEEISSGEIAIDGRVVNGVDPARRGCAMVFQNYALYPHMTVAQNIGYALKIAGVPRLERVQRVERIAATLGIEGLLARKPSQLSGGQRQRVAMGRAMVRSPSIFLFDEPLSNLDAKLRIQMRLEIKRLHRELRTTSVFVTHDQVEAMTLADKLIVMNEGLIEQAGTPSQIFRRPQSRFVANFLGSPPMNFLPATIDGRGRVRVAGNLAPWPRLVWDLPEGSRLDIAFRPGAVQLAPASATSGVLPFSAEMVEDLGTELHLHGTSAGTSIAITLPAASELPSGRLGITVPGEVVHAFLVEEGGRIEPQSFSLNATEPSGADACREKSLSFT